MTEFSFTTSAVQNQITKNFDYCGFEVRAMTDGAGNPLFVANDVAKILGYQEPKSAVKQHCKKVNKIKGCDSPFGCVDINVIPEADLYRLIMRSQLPDAEKFQDWVVEEVLPEIRKTGTYSINEPIMPMAEVELKACIELAQIFGLKGNQALLSANTAVKNLHGIDCMATLGITGLISENKKQYFTPSVLGKKIGMSAVKFNKALESSDMQVANRDHKKRLIWQVTDAGKQYCQLLDTNKKHSDGTPIYQIMWSEDVINVLHDDL